MIKLNGNPFGTLSSEKDITENDKIDIEYTLRIKPDIAIYNNGYSYIACYLF